MPPKNIPHHPKPASTASTTSSKAKSHEPPRSKSPKPPKSKEPQTLWQEAYDALKEDPKGKERLHKLSTIIKTQLPNSHVRIRSDEGYTALSSLIQDKAGKLEATKGSEKVDKVVDAMMTIQDLVGAAAGVGGPYVALPMAALFLAFNVQQIYRSEQNSMFELAQAIAHYTVLHRKAQDRIKIQPFDDQDDIDARRSLKIHYTALYKLILRATAEMIIFLYGDFQMLWTLSKKYAWSDQLEALRAQHHQCNDYNEEMMKRENHAMYLASLSSQTSLSPPPPYQPSASIPRPRSPSPNPKPKYSPQPSPTLKPKDSKSDTDKQDLAPPSASRVRPTNPLAPAPRNPLHWAVALSVPEQVTHFVQANTYNINARTPRAWTALQLAAEHGNTKIVRTLLTAPDIDLLARNDDGRTALHVACMKNKVGVVKLLLQRMGKGTKRLLEVRDNLGRTAFLLACKSGHVAVLEVLGKAGQDVHEVTGKNGWSGLHLAAENGSVETVKWLLASGVRKDVRTTGGGWKGVTAKDVAGRKGKKEVEGLL